VPDSRPNVLVVLTDQQSAGMMSCTGNPHLDTPAMDRIAEAGVRFGRAYCTNPVCGPSRNGLTTGRLPSALGVRSNAGMDASHVPDDIAANGLGNPLRDAGYDTAYAGKQHLTGDLSPGRLGFETIAPSHENRDGCADACVDFLREDRDDPFFLVASLINPHDICYMAIRDARENAPYYGGGPQSDAAEAALDEALERPPGVDEETFFAEHAPPLPANHAPQADEPEAVRDLVDQRSFRRYARDEWSAERWREHRWAYARLTERVDTQVGRLLDALDATGQRDDTVVIFTSDHGDMDAAHKLEHKTVLYEEAVRVPFVVSAPGGRTRAVDDRLVSMGLDLLPTVCGYAGVEPPAHCAGRSVRPLVEGGDPDWRSAVRIEGENGEALVTDRYKYALYDGGQHREQLYDLDADPDETRNHADDHPAVVDDLRERLLDGSAIERDADAIPR
jgi:choline-sulfatase